MQTIIPHLWFDDEAEEAAEFYTAVFEHTEIGTTTTYSAETPSDKPVGSVMTVDFTLENLEFIALNGGPEFSFNPSISFVVNCETVDEVDALWEQLSDGGEVLMPLDAYPFSERYGWVADNYGLTWQVMKTDPDGDWRPKLTPSLAFTGENTNHAEDAIEFYTAVFADAEQGNLARYPEDTGPANEGSLMYGDFRLESQWFAAMDSGTEQDFTFNEAVSLQVMCESQDEVDAFWEQLSAVPEAAQCGWLKDRYGVSWQIVPTRLNELVRSGNAEQSRRVTEALLAMKRIDVPTLERAAEGG